MIDVANNGRCVLSTFFIEVQQQSGGEVAACKNNRDKRPHSQLIIQQDGRGSHGKNCLRKSKLFIGPSEGVSGMGFEWVQKYICLLDLYLLYWRIVSSGQLKQYTMYDRLGKACVIWGGWFFMMIVKVTRSQRIQKSWSNISTKANFRTENELLQQDKICAKIHKDHDNRLDSNGRWWDLSGESNTDQRKQRQQFCILYESSEIRFRARSISDPNKASAEDNMNEAAKYSLIG